MDGLPHSARFASTLILLAALTSCGAVGSPLVGTPPTPPVQRTEVSPWGALLVNGQPAVVTSLNKFAG
ncbi:MAG: hypothetical protein QN202_04495, partial [Armatimonadota bacterium]|nr:hypothetical protein [Armatimonadota bacterium]